MPINFKGIKEMMTVSLSFGLAVKSFQLIIIVLEVPAQHACQDVTASVKI
ncbi:uncharacterized protein FPRO_14387 [Fusarium proliferatum ET1]|uniref:Uncharacterized protein n=1 Tax=Fusarium proliferatum (strain ET1) TaxID=1227346 RepID=A0A1L7VW27_FUSPR|nr:uncharacterized protein FPRO_14387 [Fusarium proliferatum ET1]CZR44634.1 uncharacterized protein FPRO_14387 [Fusarium proliferatum ET1]